MHQSKAENTTSIAAIETPTHADQEFCKEPKDIVFKNLPIQRKLSIGAADDPLEREADAIAATIMRKPEQNFIQRKCEACEEEEQRAQRKPLAHFIQKKEAEGGTVASEAVSQKIAASRGKGNPLPDAAKSFMESRFGADFSKVNIHTGNEAVQMSNELRAKAFTVGNDIYFNSGRYAPHSSSGKHLLAHELTHTMQQSENNQSNIQRSTGSSTPGSGLDTRMLEQVARRLRNAMRGWGTDEEAIYSALSGRNQEQLDQISATYQTLFSRDLLTDLQDELTAGEMRHLGIFSPEATTDSEGTTTRFDSVANQLNSAMDSKKHSKY